jgi:nucleoside-triphosphatase THEP1
VVRRCADLARATLTIGCDEIPKRGHICVLTGERGAGKSSVCADVAERAREAGYTVRGLLTEASVAAAPKETADQANAVANAGGWTTRGQTTGGRDAKGCGLESAGAGSRFVVDLSTGARFPFGSRCAPAAGAPAGLSGEVSADYGLPGWRFHAGVWERGNQILAAALPCDLLIVDELGPLEVRAGRGWSQAFAVLALRDCPASLVVCRSSLLDELVKRLGGLKLELYQVDPKSRDELPGRIFKELLGAGPRGSEIDHRELVERPPR